jgi:CheY-like chemotaxis protein
MCTLPCLILAERSLLGRSLETIGPGSVYDIVLCDLAMPGINGWEVARVALQTNPNLNFYIVTGWGEQVQSEIPRNLPVRGVLSKPIDLGKLERIAAMATEQNHVHYSPENEGGELWVARPWNSLPGLVTSTGVSGRRSVRVPP